MAKLNILRSFSAFLAMLFLLGTTLLLFLNILTGATTSSILKHFYWIETECSNFPGAPYDTKCRWTNYGICSVDGSSSTECTKNQAAHAFSPAKNFDSTTNLPNNFIDHENYYYYTSRIGWAFTLIGLAFLVFSWVPFFILAVSKLREKRSFKSIFWVLYALATIFSIVGIALSTASYARGRNHFHDGGFPASLGTNTWAVSWTAVFLLLFNIPFLLMALAKWGLAAPYYNKFSRQANPDNHPEIVDVEDPAATNTTNATKSQANYLSFTPVKETKETKEVTAGAAAVEHHDADDTLY